jgi:spore coat polysaccharide biosynthesis predicted glycosyltransferase SpsG
MTRDHLMARLMLKATKSIERAISVLYEQVLLDIEG